jgi:hypothetical protein
MIFFMALLSSEWVNGWTGDDVVGKLTPIAFRPSQVAANGKIRDQAMQESPVQKIIRRASRSKEKISNPPSSRRKTRKTNR